MRIQSKNIFNFCEVNKGVLVTLVKSEGSSLYPIGTRMGIENHNNFTGAISGGCVERDIIEHARMLSDTEPFKFIHYGSVADTLTDIGLSCGGSITVILEKQSNSPVSRKIIDLFEKDIPFFLLSRYFDGITTEKKIVSPTDPILGEILKTNPFPKNSYWSLILNDQSDDFQFLEYFPPSKKVIIIGAVPIAIPLIKIANAMHYKTILIDPRKSLLLDSNFNQADDVFGEWPEDIFKKFILDETCFLVTLSHDEKIDDNALESGLNSNANFIGALGSRKTHQKRLLRLQSKGYSEDQINRIIGPVGIKINSSMPEDIALSIMAQISSLHHNKNSRV